MHQRLRCTTLKRVQSLIHGGYFGSGCVVRRDMYGRLCLKHIKVYLSNTLLHIMHYILNTIEIIHNEILLHCVTRRYLF